MPDIPFAKKSLGQHWLQDHAALDAMCDAASVQSGDVVLEIGPGFGTLTRHLLDHGALVTALEFDETLIPSLEQKFFASAKLGKFSAIPGDIRSFDFTKLPREYKVVANIPYYLTSNLIQLLSETTNPPSTAVLLVQKEVAQRVAAGAGAMSLLSVTAQFYWDVRLGMIVPAKLFSPPPKVDSQILILERKPDLLMPPEDVKRLFRLVKAGYSQRRKTLLNSLSAGLRLEKSVVKELCDSVDIDTGRRAQTLDLDEWRTLYQAYALSNLSAPTT